MNSYARDRDRDWDRDRDRGRNTRPAPNGRSASWSERDRDNGPNGTSHPRRQDSAPTSQSALEPQQLPKIPKFSTAKRLPSPDVQNIANFTAVWAELGAAYQGKVDAKRKLHKIKERRQKFQGGDFPSELGFLDKEQKDAETQLKRCEAMLNTLDSQSQNLIFLLIEKQQKKTTSEAALDARFQTLKLSWDKQVQEVVAKHVKKLDDDYLENKNELSRQVDEMKSKNDMLEEQVNTLSSQATDAGIDSAQARKQVAQLKEDIDIPMLNEIMDRCQSQENEIAELKRKMASHAASLEPLTQRVATQEQQIKALQQQTNAYHDELLMEKKRVADLSSKLKQMPSDMSNIEREQIVSLKARLEPQVSKLGVQVQKSEQQIRTLESQIKARSAAQDTRLDQKDKQINDLTQELQTQRKAQATMSGVSKEKLDDMISQSISHYEPRVTKLEEKQQRIMDLAAQLEESIFAHRKDQKEQKEHVETKLSDVHVSIAQLETHCDNFRRQLAGTPSRQSPASTGVDPGVFMNLQGRVIDLVLELPKCQDRIRLLEEKVATKCDLPPPDAAKSKVPAEGSMSEADMHKMFAQLRDQLMAQVGVFLDNCKPLLVEEEQKREALEARCITQFHSQATTASELRQIVTLQSSEFEKNKAEISGAMRIWQTCIKEIETKQAQDKKTIDHVAWLISHLSEWKDNFNTTELVRDMVHHIDHAIPGGTREDINKAFERLNVIERYLFTPDPNFQPYKKRKVSYGPPGSSDGQNSPALQSSTLQSPNTTVPKGHVVPSRPLQPPPLPSPAHNV